MKKLIIVLILVLLLLFSITGCMGNGSLGGWTNKSNTFNYILTNEGGVWHLHKVSKWKVNSSDALCVITSCCDNRFWTSYNVSTLYANKPVYLPENCYICEQID